MRGRVAVGAVAVGNGVVAEIRIVPVKLLVD